MVTVIACSFMRPVGIIVNDHSQPANTGKAGLKQQSQAKTCTKNRTKPAKYAGKKSQIQANPVATCRRKICRKFWLNPLSADASLSADNAAFVRCLRFAFCRR